jgi:hypothetical protein
LKAVLGSFTVGRARERFDDLDAAVDPPLVEIEVDLSPGSSRLVDAESRRLGVERRFVLNHVVLLYLADLDRRTRLRQCGARKRGHSTLGR